jgi:hypothetical protein
MDGFYFVPKAVLYNRNKSNLALGEYMGSVVGKLVTDSNLGKVATELNGVTTVTIGPDDLKVDTRFSGVSVVEVPAEKNWRVYIGVKSDYLTSRATIWKCFSCLGPYFRWLGGLGKPSVRRTLFLCDLGL